MPKISQTTGVYLRNKIYWISYQVDGKQKFESSRSRLKTDAVYLLSCRRKEIAEKTEPLLPNRKRYLLTFSGLAEKYLEYCRPQRDHKSKAGRVASLVREFGTVKLLDFNLSLVETFQAKKRVELRPSKKQGGEERAPMAGASVNRLLATLKNMFTKAVEWDLVPEQILKNIRRVKLTRETAGRLRFLTGEEGRSLINACGEGIKDIVVFALNTGCRRGEILSLKWENVDLEHGFVHLAVTKNGESRTVPINDELKKSLILVIRNRGKARIEDPYEPPKNGEPEETVQEIINRLPSPYVFINVETGTRYQDIKRSFTTACKKAGITEFHFHDLRHTFASHLVMAGVDITTVSRLLGHKSLTMTLRYSHLAPGHLKKAVDCLNFNARPEV